MRFFFYGTLGEGSTTPMARKVHALMEHVGAATVPGAIFAICDPDGWYPVLAPGEGQVRGQLFATRPGFSADELAMLDAYENYDPMAPDSSQYIRCDVQTSLGAAQVYRFNAVLPEGAEHIHSGDFQQWLAETGNSPFAPSPRC